MTELIRIIFPLDALYYGIILRKWLAERDEHIKTIRNILNTYDLTLNKTHRLLATEVRALKELLEHKTIKQSSLNILEIIIKLREIQINTSISNALHKKYKNLGKYYKFELDVDSFYLDETVYAIIPAYDFDEPMDAIVFVSENENETYNTLNELNRIKDEYIINNVNNWVKDAIQGTPQHYSSSQLFRIIELDKIDLETYYIYLNENTPLKCTVIYDSVCLAGILNKWNFDFAPYRITGDNDICVPIRKTAIQGETEVHI